MTLVDLHGVALVDALVNTLTDLEFELLVRARIKREFELAQSVYPQFEDNHNECRFVHSWSDQSRWHVGIGSTYRDCVSISGEVLDITVRNAVRQYEMQHGNKLSKLLPSPVDEMQTAVEDDEIKF